jgi:hypothetical protein
MSGLKRVLDRFGLKQTEFAQLLDVSPRTVSLWATGTVGIPGPVKAYLRMLQTSEPSRRAAEIARPNTDRPSVDDGLYSLSYGASATDGVEAVTGDAVALLMAGRIVGSDNGGGTFEGTYRFDTVRQTNHFRVWLRVPPAGELVTGLAGGEAGVIVEVIANLDRPGPVASTVAEVAGKPFGLTLAYLGPLPS